MRTGMLLLLGLIGAQTAGAATFHGIFSGTVDNVTGPAPFSDGTAFTVRFEVDTGVSSPLFVGLDIGGVGGTFGNTTVSIIDNEAGIQDRFTMVSFLDSPVGVFDGKPESNLSLDFVGGTGIFSGESLAQPFVDSQFDSLSGSFDVNAVEYFGDLVITSGAYLPGPLPSVPVPPALGLFGSGLLGLTWIAGCGKRRAAARARALRKSRSSRESI